MPLPTIAGVVRCAVRGKNTTLQNWVNVHHFQYAGGASNPGQTEVGILDALLIRLYSGAAFGSGAGWLNDCSSRTTLLAIDYTPLDGGSVGWTYPRNLAGSVTTDMPPECAPVLTLLTGKRGRRYRGRIYFPAPGQGVLGTDGTLQAGRITQTINQYNGLMTAAAAAQWVPVVASYGHGTTHGVPTTWTPFATPITLVRMDPFIDVQRRRKM